MGRRAKFTPIVSDLERRIAAGEFSLSAGLPPERTLAERYGVSRLTLRKALAELSGRGMLVREKGRGTSIAPRAARAEETAPTLVYVGSINQHVYKDLYLAIGRQARAAGARLETLEVEPGNEPKPPVSELTRLLGPRSAVICDAGLLPWVDAGVPEAITALHGFSVLDLPVPECRRPLVFVGSDRARAAEVATRACAERGHRRVALLCRVQADGVPPANDRLWSGYRLACRQWLDGTELVLGMPWSVTNDGIEDHLYRLLSKLGKRGLPTAVVCDMDFHAPPLVRAAERAGLTVPGDLSVIGLGDTPWCEALRPPLASISYEVEAMARQLVAGALHGGPATTTVVHVEPRLVERGSLVRRD